MRTWRIPEWAISVAICGVLSLGAVDLYLMRRHPVKPHARATQSDNIGLRAEQDGDSLRVQWSHRSRSVANADHAILHINDNGKQREVILSGAQLDASGVRYWPESERVALRLEVFRGGLHSSESANTSLVKVRQNKLAGNAEVERLRPSPFERAQPEIVVVQYRPPSVVRPREVVEEPEPEAREESSFNRVLSKIPLLRRLGKHHDNETPQIPQ